MSGSYMTFCGERDYRKVLEFCYLCLIKSRKGVLVRCDQKRQYRSPITR